MPKKSAAAQDTMLAGMEQAASHVPEMMLALSRMQHTLFDAWLRQNIEAVDFLKARLERDRKMASEIARVEDPAEAMAAWSKFWQTALADYADEPRRLAEVMTNAASDAVAHARHDAETLMHGTKATAV